MKNMTKNILNKGYVYFLLVASFVLLGESIFCFIKVAANQSIWLMALAIALLFVAGFVFWRAIANWKALGKAAAEPAPVVAPAAPAPVAPAPVAPAPVAAPVAAPVEAKPAASRAAALRAEQDQLDDQLYDFELRARELTKFVEEHEKSKADFAEVIASGKKRL